MILHREEEGGGGHTTAMENEKRMRREIANSNERRRMQSINAGFQSLRSLLPHHEGEKLSKAAILQQTAQYIIALESEKTQLLTQNCQLKRLVDQNDNAGIVEVVQTVAPTNTSTGTQQPHALKKRKIDTIYTMQTISDSSDEGLGSMSPEPTTVTLLSSASNPTTVVAGTAMISKPASNASAVNAKEFIEMKTLLEMERRKNSALEDRLRQFTECHQTTIYTNGERISYEPHEVIEHTDNLHRHTAIVDDEQQVQTVLVDKVHHNMQNVHVLALDSIPNVGQTQVVMCAPIEHEEVEMVETMSRMDRNHPHIDDDDSRTLSPCDMMHGKEELIINSSRPQSPYADSHHMQSHPMVAHTGPSSTIRLQPILEAAIKAEPKVEVERIHSPGSMTVLKECNTDAIATNGTAMNQTQSRMFITHQNTSRQNLETIVEAIRHLEGDQLFGEIEPTTQPTQEAPLALTNKPSQHQHQHQHQPIQVEMNPFLQFRATSSSAPSGATIVSQIHPHHSINNRPGVIVVKQNS
ncbi:uncharacterized protein LOC129568807 isoform X2 [Sitodiplosis mosellana]|uniref:uncharacterized protein LOC129568807 isoform X2 n=1 Tax=Sitodiplosis mosellana TaxID=263140 RepID=UPI0024449B43|nr:uncharacterized protein LOC129568807 isoform X2 [Sitodiplosis mosellana]